MIVYRAQSTDIDPRAATLRLEQEIVRTTAIWSGSYGAVSDLLIETGELASAVLDELQPHADDCHPAAAPWIDLVRGLAQASDAAWRGDQSLAKHALNASARRAERCVRSCMPRRATRRVSEGFAYYSLGPELFAETARAWQPVQRGDHVICIGLRTIGLTLAAAVAAGLESRGVDATVLTLRPRGNPSDRAIQLSDRLQQTLQQWRTSTFLIVDEGPGLSGSSIAAVADCLSGLGIEDQRIVFVSAHQPDLTALNNARARKRWARHAVVAPDFEKTWIESGRLASAFGGGSLIDVSGGRWRERCAKAADAAVHCQHERRKYALLQDGEHRWIKFAGLGHYGRTTLARAHQAAADGWGPPVEAFSDGWLVMPELSGCSLSAGTDGSAARRLASYVGFIRLRWGTGTAAQPQSLLEMGTHNIRRLCGDRAAIQFERLAAGGHGEAVRADARQFPHEWIQSPRGTLIKTDGVDHHDDHFFPGPVDIAWDIAGVIEEWRMNADRERLFLEEYCAISGDVRIGARLPFYRAAYLACRGGYASFASDQLRGSADGDRFRLACASYRSRLRQVLND